MNKEITLSDFFGFILSRIKQILIFGLIGALLVFAYVKFGTKPTYTYSGSIIVNPFGDSTSEYNASLINAEINVSKNLIPTYVEVLTSKGLSEHISQVLKNKGIEVSANKIRSMSKFTSNEDTLIIKFSCTSESDSDAREVANAINEYAPGYVTGIIDHGSIYVVDAVGSGTSHRTNPFVMAIVAFMAVAIVVIVVNLLIMILDNRVKSIEDITSNFGYPILGNIPDFSIENKSLKEY